MKAVNSAFLNYALFYSRTETFIFKEILGGMAPAPHPPHPTPALPSLLLLETVFIYR